MDIVLDRISRTVRRIRLRRAAAGAARWGTVACAVAVVLLIVWRVAPAARERVPLDGLAPVAAVLLATAIAAATGAIRGAARTVRREAAAAVARGARERSLHVSE